MCGWVEQFIRITILPLLMIYIDEYLSFNYNPRLIIESYYIQIKNELYVLQGKNNNLTERIAEYEGEAIKLRQHISKVDHQNGQLHEVD